MHGLCFAPRVREDVDSAVASGAHGTPTFYVNGRRHDGARDERALGEAIDPPLAHRVRRLSLDFAGLPASGRVILLVELLDGERMPAEGELVAVAQALHPMIDRRIR